MLPNSHSLIPTRSISICAAALTSSIFDTLAFTAGEALTFIGCAAANIARRFVFRARIATPLPRLTPAPPTTIQTLLPTPALELRRVPRARQIVATHKARWQHRWPMKYPPQSTARGAEVHDGEVVARANPHETACAPQVPPAKQSEWFATNAKPRKLSARNSRNFRTPPDVPQARSSLTPESPRCVLAKSVAAPVHEYFQEYFRS